MNHAVKIEQEGLPAITPPTPMAMIERAVNSGADIEVIERLMALQERWEKNIARREFDAAIAAAKAEIKPIPRTAMGHNNKKYADFAAIAREIDPITSKYGLTYRFSTVQTDKTIAVTCRLSHRAGHYEETTLCGPADASGSKNAIQAIGSTLTYLQRYGLVQMLGLAVADDDDGAAATKTNGNGNGNGYITDEQADTIRALLTETKSNVDVFLKWANAPSVSDIKASAYNFIIAKLEQKKKRP